MSNVGIVGLYPHEESWTSFLTLRKCFDSILAEKNIVPTNLFSIGIGLSKMVQMYANVSEIPFKAYTPSARLLSSGIAVVRRNYDFCSALDHLFVIGKSNHILDSITEIASLKNIPVYSYLQLIRTEPSNSSSTDNI